MIRYHANVLGQVFCGVVVLGWLIYQIAFAPPPLRHLRQPFWIAESAPRNAEGMPVIHAGDVLKFRIERIVEEKSDLDLHIERRLIELRCSTGDDGLPHCAPDGDKTDLLATDRAVPSGFSTSESKITIPKSASIAPHRVCGETSFKAPLPYLPSWLWRSSYTVPWCSEDFIVVP